MADAEITFPRTLLCVSNAPLTTMALFYWFISRLIFTPSPLSQPRPPPPPLFALFLRSPADHFNALHCVSLISPFCSAVSLRLESAELSVLFFPSLFALLFFCMAKMLRSHWRTKDLNPSYALLFILAEKQTDRALFLFSLHFLTGWFYRKK